MTASGYSGTPLVRKLGYRPGFRVHWVNAPDDYADLVHPLPEPLDVLPTPEAPLDLIHLFSSDVVELGERLPLLRAALRPTGMIWVSWPKKSSGVPSSITENAVREVAFAHKLVDIKVCAVDAVWSGLKLVIPRALRP